MLIKGQNHYISPHIIIITFYMSKNLLVLALILALSASIEVAVSSAGYRCMVVYSSSSDDHLKIDMKFPPIKSQVKGEHYSIVLQNTEREEQEEFKIEQGTFRKQIQLTENVVYKLCIQIYLTRSGSQIQQYVEYKTAVKHTVNIQSTKIEVPKNLLKVQDLKESYEVLLSLGHTFQGVQGIKNSTRIEEENLFTQQNEKIKKIQLISFIELGAIVLFGVYQFFRLKGIIQNRHK